MKIQVSRIVPIARSRLDWCTIMVRAMRIIVMSAWWRSARSWSVRSSWSARSIAIHVMEIHCRSWSARSLWSAQSAANRRWFHPSDEHRMLAMLPSFHEEIDASPRWATIRSHRSRLIAMKITTVRWIHTRWTPDQTAMPIGRSWRCHVSPIQHLT